MNLIKELADKKLIDPPKFVPDQLIGLMTAGSVSYGISTENSDVDLVGLCMPPLHYIFPSLTGSINGFDQTPVFEEFQQHHIEDGDKLYDVKVYSLIRYFFLATAGNPNIIDTLFTSREHIRYSTPILEKLRENRKLFLSKACYPKFKGYAYAELKNITNLKTGKRREAVETLGYDAKNASHIFRLLGEIEQILNEHDLDLYRQKEECKYIRGGNYTLDQIREKFAAREKILEQAYNNSTLPQEPDRKAIRTLLMDIISTHYNGIVFKVTEKDESEKLRKIRDILES